MWRLLGGARDTAPVYATFGFGFFDREQLAAAAKLWVSQGFTRLKMTVGNEALRHRDKRSGHGRDPRGRGAGEGGARGGRARHRALRRRQLQSRSLPRHQAGRDDQAARHLVLRGAADAERRAADARAAPRDRHGARLRAERGAGVPLPRSAAARGGGFRAAQRRDHRRLHAVPAHRRAGVVIQRVAGERRRLGLPQHAPAGRRRERHAGRAPLSRGRTLQADLSRPADAGGWLLHDAGQARARLRAEPRCDPRDREAAAVERGRGRASAAGGSARGAGRSRTAAACPTCDGS